MWLLLPLLTLRLLIHLLGLWRLVDLLSFWLLVDLLDLWLLVLNASCNPLVTPLLESGNFLLVLPRELAKDLDRLVILRIPSDSPVTVGKAQDDLDLVLARVLVTHEDEHFAGIWVGDTDGAHVLA